MFLSNWNACYLCFINDKQIWQVRNKISSKSVELNKIIATGTNEGKERNKTVKTKLNFKLLKREFVNEMVIETRFFLVLIFGDTRWKCTKL